MNYSYSRRCLYATRANVLEGDAFQCIFIAYYCLCFAKAPVFTCFASQRLMSIPVTHLCSRVARNPEFGIFATLNAVCSYFIC